MLDNDEEVDCVQSRYKWRNLHSQRVRLGKADGPGRQLRQQDRWVAERSAITQSRDSHVSRAGTSRVRGWGRQQDAGRLCVWGTVSSLKSSNGRECKRTQEIKKEPSSLYLDSMRMISSHICTQRGPETLVGNFHKSLHWSVISLSVRKDGLKGIWVTSNEEILTKR